MMMRDVIGRGALKVSSGWREFCRTNNARFPRSLDGRLSSPPTTTTAFTSMLYCSSSSSVSKCESLGSGFVKWYLNMIASRPILTKSVTAASIFTAADLTSQVLTYDPADASSDHFKIDILRTLRMAGYGFLLSGPTLHLWFNFISTIIPKRDIISSVKKMVIGQTVYGPIITAVFFSLNAFLQGESGNEILERLKRDMIPTLKSGVMYWPFCDLITFRYVPVHLQPLVSNSFSFLWTIYLTYMASLKKVSIERQLAA